MDLSFNIYGNGTPIIFAHGFSLNSSMWAPQVEYFSSSHKVITYDLRGFGKSPVPTNKYNHHDDLHNLVTTLGINKFHLVGLSLGGEMAIDYALSYPDTLLSLTLASSSLGGYPSTVDWRVYAAEHGLGKAKENWLNHQVFASAKSKPEVFDRLSEMVNQYSGWHWLHQDPRERLYPYAIDRLEEIKAPTQVIVGKNDLSYYTEEIAPKLIEKIPVSELDVIENAGHMVNLENPTAFNNSLSRHLAKFEK